MLNLLHKKFDIVEDIKSPNPMVVFPSNVNIVLIFLVDKVVGSFGGELTITCESPYRLVFGGPFVKEEGALKVVKNMRL